MVKKQILFLGLLLFGVSIAGMAQVKVTGKVTDANDGLPLPSVYVLVKGSNKITYTDIVTGEYTIEVPNESSVLIFKSVGYGDKEETVGSRKVLNVSLEIEAESLDEIIVVAYGTATRSSFEGSASTMKGEKLDKLQVSNVSKALEGQVAGVKVAAASGQPGSDAEIRIRGMGSILAKTGALIIVDGVPFEGSLNSISSHDIESTTVLKDAAASSLYGARGSNGVVIVTTKKGKSGKAKISFNNRTGINTFGLQRDNVLTSPKEYYELFWESLRGQNVYNGQDYITAGMNASKELIFELGEGYNAYNVKDSELIDPFTGKLNPDAKLLYQENWLDEAFKTGLRQETSFSISGGNEKTNYYSSIGYLYDDSYTSGSTLKRLSGRVKVDHTVNSWLKTGVNLSYANINTDAPAVKLGTMSNIFGFGRTIAPIYPVYKHDSEGKLVIDEKTGGKVYDFGIKRKYSPNAHPIAQQERDIRSTTVDNVSAQVYAEIKFLKDFTFKVNGTMENYSTDRIEFQTPIGGDAANVGGRSDKTMQRYNAINFIQQLDWNKSINNLHNLSAMFVHEIKKDEVSDLTARKESFFIPDNPELSNGAKLATANSVKSQYALEGYLIQGKYNYDEKYYVSSSFRIDGSSKFHPDSRWGNFWSVGGAWRISKENFMTNVNWVNELKLRSSYGTQGNDGLNNYKPYENQYEVINLDGVVGQNLKFRGNKNITWEKSKMFNIGLDFTLWKKLTGSVDYFTKNIDDLLYAKPLALSEGFPRSIWENTMAMKNNGVELELTYYAISTNDFKWNVSINFTHYKNKLTALAPDRKAEGYATGDYFRRKGASYYNHYTYKSAGVNPDNGDPLFYKDVKDANGNITDVTIVNNVEGATRYEVGKTSDPDLFGGFSTNVNFKGFDLSIQTSYQIGGYAYDKTYNSLMTGGSAGTNWHKDIYKRWTPDNRYTDVPRLQANYLPINSQTDKKLTNLSYFSIQNVTLGYTFPTSLVSKIGLDRLRLYLVGDNLFLFSARKGFDPRTSWLGDITSNYSIMRTISFGINVNF